jgi:competence protein ComEA
MTRQKPRQNHVKNTALCFPARINCGKEISMKRKQLIGEYFQFTRKDRIATLIIAFVLLVAFFLPELVKPRASAALTITDTGWVAAIRQLEKQKSASAENSRDREGNNDYNKYVYDRTADGYNNGARGELFSFDPNTLSPDGWKKLGLRDKTIKTILNYLQKGGKFRKPQDLQRVYGLKAGEYERLREYVQIKDAAPALSPAISAAPEKPAYPTRREIKTVDINTADSLAFEALPGIGATLAMRIIRFREKLGGFYSVEQVKETFGLADSTFTRISPYLQLPNPGSIHQININTAGLDELKAHPYIRYNLARVIVNYRQQHGPFTTLEDLKKITVIDAAQYEKLKAYLTIEK